jgi:hypothetical protein
MEKSILKYVKNFSYDDVKKISLIKNNVTAKMLNNLWISNNLTKHLLREKKINETLEKYNNDLHNLLNNKKYLSEKAYWYIKDKINHKLIYNTIVKNREIQIIFYLKDKKEIKNYEKKMIKILHILFFLSNYATNDCATKLKIHCILTDHKKVMPCNNDIILNKEHVNSAFTTSCVNNGDIVLYRKEEWFKILIHELFHILGLDFSAYYKDIYSSKLREKLNINSTYLIYETYSEFWATIINTIYYTYFVIYEGISLEKINFKKFNEINSNNINIEITYSLMQVSKILYHMNITFEELWSNETHNKILREEKYKEDTNVLAYYILKTNLLLHYGEMFEWCLLNNRNLLYFTENSKNIYSFVEKIIELSVNKKTQKKLKYGLFILFKIRKEKNKELLKTNRMTLLENE